MTEVARLPSKVTLKKYGLELWQWQRLLQLQNGVCAVCQKLPPSKSLCVDHEHVKAFKKMAARDKLRHVRGLLCSYCNRYKVAKNNQSSAVLVLHYLTVRHAIEQWQPSLVS